MKYLHKYNENMINFDEFDTEEHTSVEQLTDKDFVNFLYDERVYDKFIHNIKNSHPYEPDIILIYCDNTPRPLYVYNAFTWADTREGSDFWVSIHKKWKDHLNHAISSMVTPLTL